LLFYVSVAYLVVALFVGAAFYMLDTNDTSSGQEVLAEAAATGFSWPIQIWKFMSTSS